jgi:hypothetical protein
MSRAAAFVVLAMVWVVGGCDSGETGYVQIRVSPPTATGALSLFLEGVRLDFSRSPTQTLQFKTGLLALKGGESAWAPAICKVAVRKNRIIGLTVTAGQGPNPLKCVCEIRGAASTVDLVVCA